LNSATILALAQNAALLLAMVLLLDLVTADRKAPQRRWAQLAVGALAGAIGMLLMMMPWQFAPGIFFDPRSILLSVSGLFFGPLPTAIAMAMTAALRIAQGGAALTGVLVILASGSIGIAWRHFHHRAGRRYSLGELYLFSLLVQLAMLALMFTLPREAALRVLAAISLPVLLVHPLAGTLLCVLMLRRLRRQRTEAQLRLSEERLRLALGAANQGLYDMNVQTGEAVVNDEYARMLGYDPAEFRETNAAWIARLHPDDREVVAGVYRDYIEGKRPDYQVEFRQRARSGAWVRILSLGKVVERDAQGRPLRMLGTHTDITARRNSEDRLRSLHAEATRQLALADQSRRALLSTLEDQRAAQARLAESEARFRLLIEKSNAGMYVLREERFVYANPRMAEILGRPAEALVGTPLENMLPEEERHTVSQARQKLGAGEHAVAFTTRARHADGSIVELGISEVATDFAGAPALIGIAQDIGERMRAQAEIQRYIAALERTTETALHAMSLMVEQRDPYTAGHERRVGQLAAAIGTELGFDAHRVKGLLMTGMVHDIGKLAVPAEILSKPSRLSHIEFELIKGHARYGYEVLKGIDSPWPLAEVVLQHHERLDGSGYPQGLKGDAIRLEARILAVADTVEAMSSHRPYRPGRGIEAALEEVRKESGRLYDPQAVAACVRLFEEKRFAFAD